MTEEIKVEPAQSTNGSPIQTDWSMFKKEHELGEGSFGTVFKVKCLKTSVVSSDSGQRVAMTTSKNWGSVRRKLNLRAEGVNMSTAEGTKQRSLIAE